MSFFFILENKYENIDSLMIIYYNKNKLNKIINKIISFINKIYNYDIMDSFSDLFKKENMGQLLLSIIFIIYLIMGYKTPDNVASMVDTIIGKLILVTIVIYLFMYKNPILAILGLFVAFDLYRRSSISTEIDALKRYLPTESHKMSQFNAFNQFPYTLEQEIVNKMAPIVRSGTSLIKPSYKPLIENLYDASPINS